MHEYNIGDKVEVWDVNSIWYKHRGEIYAVVRDDFIRTEYLVLFRTERIPRLVFEYQIVETKRRTKNKYKEPIYRATLCQSGIMTYTENLWICIQSITEPSEISPIPHFNIFKSNEDRLNWVHSASISMETGEYLDYLSHTERLTKEEVDLFNDLMTEEKYKESVDFWNTNNEGWLGYEDDEYKLKYDNIIHHLEYKE